LRSSQLPLRAAASRRLFNSQHDAAEFSAFLLRRGEPFHFIFFAILLIHEAGSTKGKASLHCGRM
jgi:hypothetical protein